MPRTADRFPGEREDEGLLLEDQGPGGLAGGDPGTAGGMRFVTDRFKLLDVLGLFNARSVHVDTVNPTATDDDDNGFSVGMWWLNTASGDVYICRDNTATAAVWVNPTTGLVADERGQHLVSLDGSTFSKVQPVVSPDDGWLSNCDGELLVEGLDPA